MKKLIATTALIATLISPTLLSADKADGLNVLVNSGEPQTQAMAMVLSLMSIKKHHKKVNIVLCGLAGDLADKNIEGVPVKRPNGKAPSAKDHLKLLIKKGAKVQVCPLYLPNAGKDKSVLLKGITVAKPPMVAGQLLNEDFANVTF
ncbi:MAG: hypothetical protein JJW00_03545 [Sulfurimonas sp.]|nr:hypothetical protein [Sulfurimonas sp.]